MGRGAAALGAFVAAHKEPLWQARGQYETGLLLQAEPHQGYRVGTRLYRGNNYPHTDSAEKPEYVYLQQDDAQAAKTAFEAAVQDYERLPPAQRNGAASEEADLYFDLAKTLPRVQPWGSDNDWKAAKTTDWAVHPALPYDTKWPMPKKVLFLLARIPVVDPADAHTLVLTAMARALFIAQAQYSWIKQEYVAPVHTPGKPDRPGGWRIVQIIPYSRLDAAAILKATADKYPNDPQAPQIRLILAQWTEDSGQYVQALALYWSLLARYPGCKWDGDARNAVARISSPSVSLSTPGPQPTGVQPALTISSRNLKTLTLRAYQVPLDAVLDQPGKLNNPANHFTDFSRNFGRIAQAVSQGTKVAEWTYLTHDKGDYTPQSETVRAPISQRGAYLVVAEDATGAVRGATVVLMTDLTIVRKTDKDAVLCFVADSRSGEPVANAHVVVRETYNQNSPAKVYVTRGQTDAQGVFQAPRLRQPDVDSTQIEAFASAPGARYALTNSDWGGWYDADSNNRDEIHVYAYTDRPVYRPAQTVSFRELLTRRKAGSDFAPLVGVPVEVRVNDSRGTQIYDQTLTSSQFGSISGAFPLGKGATLGEYNVSVSIPSAPNASVQVGDSRFRVEEYKKPEYLVSVTPSSTQARFGDTVTATVQATYYYGAPVVGAKVTYKIFRNPYYPQYHFPQPYDWLYQPDGGDYNNQGANQGEIVAQGSGALDDKGQLKVSFVAAKGTRDYDGDYAYTVIADVVDASRRQIEGEGIVKVAHQQFYAYLNVPNGFYHEGDIAQIELRAQDANDKPVSASGTLTVCRLTYGTDNKEIATPVHTQTVATDADGKAFTTWRADRGGQYRVEWQALDSFQQKVSATAALWVGGADFAANEIHVGGISLLTDKTTYGEGDTAHLLVIADQPDDWVMLTSETGNQILSHVLYHVAGRTRTIDVPIVRAHVPNFALAAVSVRDNQVYQWQQEVFVPPVRQLTTLAVTSDKAEYRPGETGIFHVKATDWQGRPVASEVSLAVVDSSIYYIQKEYAPDIRKFYYGNRRSINVNIGSSQDARVDNKDESDLPAPAYKEHGIVLPDFGRSPEQGFSPYYNGFGFPQSYHIYRSVYGKYAYLSGGFGGGGFGNGSVVLGWPVSSYSISGRLEQETKSQPNNLYQFPGLVFGQPGMSADAAGYVHVRGSDFNQVGYDVDGIQVPGLPHYAQAKLRTHFPDTAFWTPAVVTSAADGTATLTVLFPDTLTTWKATARGTTTGVQVGAADGSVITNKKLLVRLESPRFFVERDQVTLSAIVRNDLATAKTVRVSLTTDPDVLAVDKPLTALTPQPPLARQAESLRPRTGEGEAEGKTVVSVTVPAASEKRVDWTANVVGSGEAHVQMTAETDEESDAVAQTFTALAYGVQKFTAQNGVLQSGQNSGQLTVTLPAERRAGTAALLVQINPSLAATTLDALPYLADYPYGCVEQTMSRFLPSVLVAKTLRDAGADLDTLHKRAQAMADREQAGTSFGQSKDTTPDTDQTGYTYPSGTPGVMKAPLLAEGLVDTDRWNNPVFDPATLQSMEDDGLARLLTMQRPDGGWGWWPDSAESDAYMSAYVVYGLATAKSAGLAVPDDVLSRGYDYLTRDIKDRDDEPDLAMWEAFALSQRPGPLPPATARVVGVLYAQRDKLSPYGQALLALTLHGAGQNAEAQTVCRNLQNTATIDRENGTATWLPRDDYWWRWYNDNVETVAWVLKAYVAILPHSDLTPMLVKWLAQNKRGNAWHSTKETAMAVYALTDYIRANNELAPDYTVTVALGDKIKRTFTVTRDNALLFDNQFLVPDNLLTSGPQTVTITKQGSGRLYYASALQYVTTEEKISGTGTELKIQRRYFRLTPKTKTQKDYAGGTFNTLDYDRAELADGANLSSGDLIEVDLTLDAKNDYDYCCFEDMKPAGCEPIDLRSGGRGTDTLWSDMELRDTKTVFFVDHLPQGNRVLRYRLRAEVPGRFHALPTNGYAMYAPDVRALSDSWHVAIADAK